MASVGTVVSLAMISKSRYWWLVYSCSAVAFTMVCIYNHIWGLTCMGICLGVVGLKNFKETK